MASYSQPATAPSDGLIPTELAQSILESEKAPDDS